MRTSFSVLALAASGSAATISIDVGKDGSLVFHPNSVTAAVGDSLEFHFYSDSGGHSVVSSAFSTPCLPATNAFFSGYIPGDESGDTTFIVPVNSTDPIWYYCSLQAHCQEGMVGVINPPSGKTAADYARAAGQVGVVSAPAALQGGVLTSIGTSSSPSSTSSSSKSTTGNEKSTLSSTAVTTTSSLSGTATDTGVRSSAATSGSASSVTGVGTDTDTRGVPTSTSASASAATTSASAGMGMRERSDLGALMGLAAFAGGLVALMA